MNGLSLLHAVGPEPPLQAGALQASIAWMMAAVNTRLASRQHWAHMHVVNVKWVDVFCVRSDQSS